jgi:hypothetical protein
MRIAIVLLLSLAVVTAVQASPKSYIRQKVAEHRQATWSWQDVMGTPRTAWARHELKTGSKRYLSWLARTWWHRRVRAMQLASNPPHLREWLCIHRYEGSWTDPNAPYYGGLQMDMDFQRAYGWNLLQRKGTADNWTPLEQMWVAERAYRTRGFYPWPNTARYCGLL